MSRIRSVKPEFFTSEQVVECSPTARLLFVGLWCFCDDAGIHPASPKRLKMEVFPADDISSEEVLALVGELIRAGLVREYEVKGERFWIVTGWHHQKIDKPTFRHPKPNFGEASARTRREVGEASGTESKGVESSRRDWRRDEESPHTQPLPTAVGRGSTEVPPVCVVPPSAPGPKIKRTTDADLQPWFEAATAGLGQPLSWAYEYVLPTERIVAQAERHALSPADVRAIAAHYRAKCKDGTPNFGRFADSFDRWRAAWLASRGGASPAIKTGQQLRAEGRCSEHPGERLDAAGRCELCDEVAELRERLRTERTEAVG